MAWRDDGAIGIGCGRPDVHDLTFFDRIVAGG
jgi:hypothetical protein